jgi:hypothetical protein
MKKSSLNFFEVHVEKFVLGLTGVFLLGMLWMFLIQSPNKVNYGGEEVTPRGLHEAILSDARSLQRKIDQAVPEEFEAPKYSQQLKQEYDQGILGGAAEGPQLPQNLRLATMFGQEIAVPGLKEEEVAGSIALITPLKPAQPALRTGRSKVVRTQVSLDDEGDSAGREADEAETVAATEVAWVSIAAQFDTKAQRNEMTKAGYAPYLANPYVVGVDVERQEVLASGEWSDWTSVEPTKAMPKLGLPTPVIDDETGAVLNKEKIYQAFNLVRQEQTRLMQPSFYDVEAGDEWVNPLEVEEEEEEDDEEAIEQRRQQREERRARQPVVRAPVRRSGGGRRAPGGGGGIGMIGGGGRFGGGGRVGGGASSGQAGALRERTEGQRQARENLRQARDAYKQKDYNTAHQLASRVLDNEHARKSDQRAAEKLLRDIQRRREKEQPTGGAIGAGGMVGGRYGGGMQMMGGGPRGMGGGAADAGARGAFMRPDQPSELYRDPETNQPAIWFHDDTVESGKTYRYRMCARLWNRYVGRMRPLQNPEDAKQSVLTGEWSLPSDPITVTPSTYFFVRNPRLDKKSASMEVWKWREGEWLDERFDIEVGDVIGGVEKVKLEEWDEDGKQIRQDIDFTTDALVLDLRFDEPIKHRVSAGSGFNYSEKTTLVLVYLDPADGQVKERVQLFDKYDPIRKKLEDEAW